MTNILGSVGRGGRNNPADVRVVQQLINTRLPAGLKPLAVDGVFGPKTLAAIVEFQRRHVPSMTPGAVISAGDATWRMLTQPMAGPRVAFSISAPPASDLPAKFTFDQFWNFTEPLEGGHAADCMLMVQDRQVATGMGITFTGRANRNEGLERAKKLEWVHKATRLTCSPGEIEADYDKVLEIGDKGTIPLVPGHLEEWKKVTICRITKEGLKKGVRDKVIFNINYVRTQRKDRASCTDAKLRDDMRRYLGDFDSFPADAQLCIISLTWASGNEFMFPKFAEACRARDWFRAAKECGFSSKENTLPQRQAAQELMMHNAGCVELGAGDPNVLHWPSKLARPGPQPPAPPSPQKHTERFRERPLISRG